MRGRLKGDDGLTLVELVVTIVIMGIVISVLGGMFVSITRTERAVAGVTTATSNGQLATRSVEHGIRNASAATVKLTAVGSDQLLVARTAGAANTVSYSCSAWYYSAANKSIRFRTSPTAIAAPNSSALSGWTLLLDGVTPVTGTTVFAKNGSQITMSFSVSAASSKAVRFDASALAPTVTEATQC